MLYERKFWGATALNFLLLYCPVFGSIGFLMVIRAANGYDAALIVVLLAVLGLVGITAGALIATNVRWAPYKQISSRAQWLVFVTVAVMCSLVFLPFAPWRMALPCAVAGGSVAVIIADALTAELAQRVPEGGRQKFVGLEDSMRQQAERQREIQTQLGRNRRVTQSLVAATLIRVEALGANPSGAQAGDSLQDLFLADVAAIVSGGNRALFDGTGGYDVIERVQQRADAYFQYIRGQAQWWAQHAKEQAHGRL